MITISPVHLPPDNVDSFVTEIEPGIRDIFGVPAGERYRSAGAAGLAASLMEPGVRAWCASVDGEPAGLLFMALRHSRHLLSFIHVLGPFQSQGVEQRLLDCALTEIGETVTPIVSDYLALCPLDLSDTYLGHGFRRTARLLMCHRGKATAAMIPSARSVVEGDLPAIGDLLAAVYADHPERYLFPEVQSQSAATAFLDSVRRGAYGYCGPDHIVGHFAGNVCRGIAVGTFPHPGAGFVLHLAVHPRYQGRGLGSALLQLLHTRLLEGGADRVLLGVSNGNRAIDLYKRLGFLEVCPLPVFHRGLIETGLDCEQT